MTKHEERSKTMDEIVEERQKRLEDVELQTAMLWQEIAKIKVDIDNMLKGGKLR